MTWVRCRLRPLAMLWLFGQVTTFTIALPACWLGSGASNDLACTCPQESGSMCPMHHDGAPDPARCSLHSSADSGAVALRSLLGAVGLVIARPVAASLSRVEPAPSIVASSVTRRTTAPDAPPPRA